MKWQHGIEAWPTVSNFIHLFPHVCQIQIQVKMAQSKFTESSRLLAREAVSGDSKYVNQITAPIVSIIGLFLLIMPRHAGDRSRFLVTLLIVKGIPYFVSFSPLVVDNKNSHSYIGRLFQELCWREASSILSCSSFGRVPLFHRTRGSCFTHVFREIQKAKHNCYCTEHSTFLLHCRVFYTRITHFLL